MFTDLFNLTQKAVTVFKSSDKNAPSLTGDAGSLKTVLKACLVTGYGDKAGLGWQMKFESEDLTGAVFVSQDVTSDKYHLKIVNPAGGASCFVYEQMTSYDDGTRAMVDDFRYDVANSDWILVGHSKAFVLLTDRTVRHNGNTRCAYPLLFGDIPRQTSRTGALSVFWCAVGTNRDNYYQGVGGVQSTLFVKPNGSYEISDRKIENYAYCHPFRASFGSNGGNITDAACRFHHNSRAGSHLLYEPILIGTDDGGWGLIPMLMPVSASLEQKNLSQITPSTILARTGWYTDGNNNNDCLVPTNFWWA